MRHDTTYEPVIVVLLCCLWYTTSSVNNVIGKIVLTEFPYPFTVTLGQLLSIVVYSGPLLRVLNIHTKVVEFSWKYYVRYVLSLGFGKFVAVTFSLVSIAKVPVSYAHTVKATMPLFTVILSRILINEHQSTKVYVSLFPILVGVGIASITEISFDLLGLLAALFSTATFAVLHIFSKKVMQDSGIHHFQLLLLVGKIGLAMFVPVWVVYDGFALLKLRENDYGTPTNWGRVLFLIWLDGLLNWVQNVVAYRLLSLLTPLSYSVASATKRITVIILSIMVLGNPVTSMNVFGMLLAILGVFAYNKVKHQERIHLQKLASTPLSHVTVDYGSPSKMKFSYEELNRQFGSPLQAAPLMAGWISPDLGNGTSRVKDRVMAYS